MRPLLIALLLAAPVPAMAQSSPSFDCAAARLPTEFAVCRDEGLARLDVTMAEMFFDEFDFIRERRPDEVQAFRDEQRLWQRWRNTCGDDPGCLTRRYRSRILDFDPAFVFDTDFRGEGEARGAVRLHEGRLERQNSDGSVSIYTPDGELVAIRLSSGETMSVSVTAIQVGSGGPVEPPPTPPAADDPWLVGLEQDLLSVVDGILPPDDHAAYRDLHAGAPTPVRVERHITSIGILSR